MRQIGTEMSNYANKTCYDCGVKKPANQMERVTEEYTSGRSDNKVTAGNVAWAAFSDTAAKKVKRTIVANNRRSYTRNRTVWKCMDCSGTNAWHRKEVATCISKGIKAVGKAKKGGWFSAPKELSSEVQDKLSELKSLQGKTSSKTAKDLLADITESIKKAPDVSLDNREPVFLERIEAKVERIEAKAGSFSERMDAKADALNAKADAFNERMDAKANNSPIGIWKKIGLCTSILFGCLLLLAVVLKITEGDYKTWELLWSGFLGFFMTYQPLEVMVFRPRRIKDREAKKTA